MQEFFDPLTKTINGNSEQNLALGKQTLRALNWQNRELHKLTRAITETASQFGEAASRMVEDERASTLRELETQADPLVTIVTDTVNILHLMVAQSNPRLVTSFNIAKRE